MPEPAVYQRVADDLRRQIGAGELPAGARLPSRSALSAQYGVGPNVAIAAVRALVAEGVVTSRAGSGIFVRERHPVHRMMRSWHPQRLGGSLFIDELGPKDSGGTRESQSTTQNAPKHIAARLGIPPGSRVMRTDYRFHVADAPAMLSTSWEPLTITGGTPIVLPEAGPYAGRGIVERMASIGVAITRAREEVTPRPATREEATALQIPASGIVAGIERTYLAGDRPVETSDIVVPADRYRLVYDFPVDALNVTPAPLPFVAPRGRAAS
jgi:GntR family transcriptional regulator